VSGVKAGLCPKLYSPLGARYEFGSPIPALGLPDVSLNASSPAGRLTPLSVGVNVLLVYAKNIVL